MYMHPLCINTEGYIFERGILAVAIWAFKTCVPEGRKCEERKDIK
jgi:hypothetical protein